MSALVPASRRLARPAGAAAFMQHATSTTSALLGHSPFSNARGAARAREKRGRVPEGDLPSQRRARPSPHAHAPPPREWPHGPKQTRECQDTAPASAQSARTRARRLGALRECAYQRHLLLSGLEGGKTSSDERLTSIAWHASRTSLSSCLGAEGGAEAPPSPSAAAGMAALAARAAGHPGERHYRILAAARYAARAAPDATPGHPRWAAPPSECDRGTQARSHARRDLRLSEAPQFRNSSALRDKILRRGHTPLRPRRLAACRGRCSAPPSQRARRVAGWRTPRRRLVEGGGKPLEE